MSKFLLTVTALAVLVSATYGWNLRQRPQNVDCIVSEEYGNWSECVKVADDAGNFYSARFRSKIVIVPQEGKGEPCPPDEEELCNEEEDKEEIENEIQVEKGIDRLRFELANLKKSGKSRRRSRGRSRGSGSSGSSSGSSGSSSGSSGSSSGSSGSDSSSDSSGSDSSRSRSRSSRRRRRRRRGSRSRSRSGSRSGSGRRRRRRRGGSGSRSRSRRRNRIVNKFRRPIRRHSYRTYW